MDPDHSFRRGAYFKNLGTFSEKRGNIFSFFTAELKFGPFLPQEANFYQFFTARIKLLTVFSAGHIILEVRWLEDPFLGRSPGGNALFAYDLKADPGDNLPITKHLGFVQLSPVLRACSLGRR